MPERRPQQARSQALVSRILQAAIALHAREGLAACNTNRIAREAGISIGSLYQYFPTKEAIFSEIWRSQDLDLAKAIRACPTNSLENWLESLIEVFVEHKDFAHQDHPGETVDAAIRDSFSAFQSEIPSGLAPDIAGDMRAIILALLQRETKSLAGWEYTLSQRIRRALKGYLAVR
jgi:AcrR family transcriptional regulator